MAPFGIPSNRLTKYPWKSLQKQAGPAATAVPSHRNSWWRWSWSRLAVACRSCSFPTNGWPSASGDLGSSTLRYNWWHLAQASTVASHEEGSRLVAILETSCKLQWSHWTAWSPVAALLLASQQASCMPFAMRLISYMPKVPVQNRCVSPPYWVHLSPLASLALPAGAEGPAMAGHGPEPCSHGEHGGCLSRQTSHMAIVAIYDSLFQNMAKECPRDIMKTYSWFFWWRDRHHWKT